MFSAAYFVSIELIHNSAKSFDIYSNAHLNSTLAALVIHPIMRLTIMSRESNLLIYQQRHSLSQKRAVKYVLALFWVSMIQESMINFLRK